jgi:hypothetical protein
VLGERTLDGMCLGLAYSLGQLASYLFHIAFQTGYGRVIAGRLRDGELSWLASSSVRGFLIGLVIGFFVVRDIRRVSHSHVVELPQRRREPATSAAGANGAADDSGLTIPQRGAVQPAAHW